MRWLRRWRRLHIHGHSPSWPALYPHAACCGAAHLSRSSTAATGWPPPRPLMSAPLGWAGAEHPLLGAVTELADQDQIVVSWAVVDGHAGLVGRSSGG